VTAARAIWLDQTDAIKTGERIRGSTVKKGLVGERGVAGRVESGY